MAAGLLKEERSKFDRARRLTILKTLGRQISEPRYYQHRSRTPHHLQTTKDDAIASLFVAVGHRCQLKNPQPRSSERQQRSETGRDEDPIGVGAIVRRSPCFLFP